jgi:hypothetical protein
MIDKHDAEEFSQSLEQIGEGWFRQLALGIKLKVPEALGLSRREWSDRIGLKVRDRAERINIEVELSAEGLSNRAIADVLGVDEGTVRNDRRAAPPDAKPEEDSDQPAENSAPDPGAYSLINLECPAVKALPEHNKRDLDGAVYELCCCIAFLEWFREQRHNDEVDAWGALFEISKRYRRAASTFCVIFPGNARYYDALKIAGKQWVETKQALRAAERLARERAP